jgi:hypothetical protein
MSEGLAKSLQEMLNSKAAPMGQNQSGGNNCGAKYGGQYKSQSAGNYKSQSAGKRKSRGKKCKGRKSRGRKSRRKL